MKQSNIIDFQHLSNFKSLKDLNNNIEMFLVEHKKDFTKGEYVSFMKLTKYCAKVPGIATAKIGTILKAINEDKNDMGVSRSTFKRMLVKAKTLGILTVHETERKNGSQSSNLYVFNRFECKEVASVSNQNEPPNDEILNCPETINLFNTNNQKDIKRNDDISDNIQDSNFVARFVDKSFAKYASKYFYANEIEELWKCAKFATKHHTYYTLQDRLDVATDSLNQLVRAIKLHKPMKSIYAFYWGIINNVLDDRYKDEMLSLYAEIDVA
jgi:hypothetical protein